MYHPSLRCRALWGALEEDNNNIMPILPVSSPRLNTQRDNFEDNTDHRPAEDIIPTTSTATTVPTVPVGAEAEAAAMLDLKSPSAEAGARMSSQQEQLARFRAITRQYRTGSGRAVVRRKTAGEYKHGDDGLSEGSALFLIVILLLSTLFARGVLARAAKAIAGAISRAWSGADQADDHAAINTAAAVGHGNGDAISTSIDRGSFAGAGVRSGGKKKANNPRSSFMASFKRVLPRWPGHGRTVSNASRTTMTPSVDGDGSTGDMHPGVSAASQGGAADRNSARRSLPAFTDRWSGFQGIFRKAPTRRPFSGISALHFKRGGFRLGRARPATDKAA